jgi:arylsulfatase A
MNLRAFLPCLLLLAAGSAPAAPAPPPKPNIIFILADDLGLGNVSACGADNFKTPHLDALAKSGTRFEQCYSAPLCGPSRALIMTGRYAFRTGMTGNDTGATLHPTNEVMMPTVLKTAGYATAMCGKWSQLPLQPGDWGFDEYLKFQGSGAYWNSQKQADHYILNGATKPLADGEYMPDLMHRFAVDFITRHQDKPFYLYYSMSHIHGKILRTPDSAPGSKDFYTDNIAYMDKLVGQLVAELDRLKLREKTLIVFVGDNGTTTANAAQSTVQGKRLSGAKGSLLEGGSRVPMITSWPGNTPADRVSTQLVDFSDYFPTLAQLAGAKLPEGVTIDGKSFARQLRGRRGPGRDWVYVQLGNHWYAREAGWKLTETGALFNMAKAPFEETAVDTTSTDPDALAARKRLQTVLDQLSPATGKVSPSDGKGSKRQKRKQRAAA